MNTDKSNYEIFMEPIIFSLTWLFLPWVKQHSPIYPSASNLISPPYYYPHCKEFLKCKWYFQCFLDKIQSCSCPTMDCSLPGSSVHGISQARILEWVAISSPGYLPNPGIKPVSPALQADPLQRTELTSYTWVSNCTEGQHHNHLHCPRVNCLM